MLQRKQSLRLVRDEPPSQIGLFDHYSGGAQQQQQQNAAEDQVNGSLTLDWINKKWVIKIIRICALLSFISICLNTPATIKHMPFIMYITFSIDILCSILFTAEMLTKIKSKGLYKNENSYLFDRWCQFDCMMLIFHWVSVLIQLLELSSRKPLVSYWSILRCPRPLILIRLIRAFLKFRLPKNRLNSILQRSSSQIYNVTIFFLFFMALYGILGVQFFGELTSHCVKNDSNPENIYLNNLMIPDTYCSSLGPEYGYQCPSGMKCVELKNIKREDRGFNGFDEIVTSIFTVYEAASQEGWVFLMYRATDSLPSWRAFFYFITMIFFLAWLVKNVFIAVIIETFAEIRVQFQQMWGARGQEAELEQQQVFERTPNGCLKLITKDENKSQGLAPKIFLRVLRSSGFNMTFMTLVLANAVITATMKYTHIETVDKQMLKNYYYFEAFFTLLFDLEVLFKIFCVGFKAYIKRSIFKFEFILAIGTTIRLVPVFYQTEFTYFQVLRIVRLIKSSPMLEDFVNKIFGPGKKLGSLIIFTMCLLIITSCVSMQLFCFLSSDKYKKFDTFDQAFMNQFSIMTNEGWTELMFDTMKEAVNAYRIYTYFIPIYFIFCHMFCSLAFMTMFQVLTQKGWVDIMHQTMRQSNRLSPLVAIYFISYHLFVTLIVLSLFVAVILDNLELEEDVKKIKQLKMREQSAETQENLPWRLRIFEQFPNQPQMITLNRLPSEFVIPKIRESFMRQFLGDDFGLQEFKKLQLTSNSTNAIAASAQSTSNNTLSTSKKLSLEPELSTTSANTPSFKYSFSSNKANNKNLDRIPENVNDLDMDLFELDDNNLRQRRFDSQQQQHQNGHYGAPYDRHKNAPLLKTFNKHAKTQKGYRYGMKKEILTQIILNSNDQRLLSGDQSNPNTSIINDNFKTSNKSHLHQHKNFQLQSINRTHAHTVPSGLGGLNTTKSVQLLSRNLQSFNGPAGAAVAAAAAAASGTGLNGVSDIDFKMYQFKKQQAELKRNQLEDDLKENHPYFDKPLFTIGRESNIRRVCKMLVEARYKKKDLHHVSLMFIKKQYKQIHKIIGLVSYLDWIMIFVTITSSISIAFENPQRRIMDNWQLQVAEFLFVISMSIEITLKTCAYGFLFTPNAMMKDFAGFLDLFIYLISLIFLIQLPNEVSANSGAQMLMLLRCLRPLRIFTLVPHMRKVIYELCRGFKEILLVSILLVVLIFIFANYGVQIYGGKLARCNDIKTPHRDLCMGLYKRNLSVSKLRLRVNPNITSPSIWVPRIWSNPYNFDFDTISHSMLALFEVLSLEGWLEVRDVIIDRMGTRHAIFVHIFVFIGTLIGLTLFVGVVITNYSENKGTALLTVDQRRWLDLKGRIKLAQPLHIPPRPENSIFRAFVFDITQHKTFKRLSAFFVLLNCSLLSVPWKVNDYQTTILATIAVVFTMLFLLEAFMKVVALGPVGFWQSRRNRFDLFVTFLGLLWIIIHFISFSRKDLQSTSHSIGFVIIVLRFFTIAGKHATLKMLMLTIIVSFYKSFFIILGMFLLMLVYAFAGVILFGAVKSGHDLGRHANFKSTANAIVLLMRIVTGEDWNKIMHDCMIAPPVCTKAKNYWESDCGNFTASLLYFCSFYVIITYIVLNLLVAIIMENFSLFYSNEEDALLSYNDIRHFQIIWNIVDINRKGVIPCKRVKFLLRLLRGRLEVDLEKDRFLFKHMCYEIEKLNNGSDVTFHDVLNMLSYRSVDIRKSLKLEELLAREELEYQIEEEVAKQTIRNWLNKCLRRIREKGQTNLIKSLQKQNDIAIFKEQMGARQHLLTQPILSSQLQATSNLMTSTSTSVQSIQQAVQREQQQQVNYTGESQQNLSHNPPQTPTIGFEITQQQPLQQQQTQNQKSSLNVNENKKLLQRTPSINTNHSDITTNGNMQQQRPNELQIASSLKPEKSIRHGKKSNAESRHQTQQIVNDERQQARRNNFLLETQTQSDEMKLWWSNTINDTNSLYNL